ncbi:MAG TPA: glycosyl hydrolase [Gammaproteobacteria bacterium]|nr:glycosyl hydrolase [Gammaproteobacteria bacterium]
MGLALLAVLWLAGWAAIVWRYRGQAHAAWAEPVLNRPVLVLESDDWGPGPELHADRLRALAGVLRPFRDSRGRPPVMTLGMVLAVADTQGMAREQSFSYRRVTLADRRFAALLQAIEEGRRTGVFVPQLHGMEHYWPPTLMSLAASDATIRAWFLSEGIADSACLPSHLQSRWTDASMLPSQPLSEAEVEKAVQEETEAFKAILGVPPSVAVPPTFVWTAAVEDAWARAGVTVIVTPGRRYEGRGLNGAPDRAGPPIYNGQMGGGGLVYVVRDAYFEPTWGHTAEQALAALAAKSRLGRPALLETHRFNFVGDAASCEAALKELARLLEGALARFPGLAFMSTEELAEAMHRRVPDLIASAWPVRLHFWLARLAEIPRLRQLAWFTGLALLVLPLLMLTAPRFRSGVMEAR